MLAQFLNVLTECVQHTFRIFVLMVFNKFFLCHSSYNSFNSFNSCSKTKRADTRQPSYIFHLTSRRSAFQLPRRVVVAAIRAASAGSLGFLGHDVGCNVLHLLSLLVQRTLGYAAFTKRSD